MQTLSFNIELVLIIIFTTLSVLERELRRIKQAAISALDDCDFQKDAYSVPPENKLCVLLRQSQACGSRLGLRNAVRSQISVDRAE